MAFSALSARLGLSLGRSCATRIAKVSGDAATTAFGHSRGAGGFRNIRRFYSSAEASFGSRTAGFVWYSVLPYVGIYLLAEHFHTTGKQIAKIEVAVDKLVELAEHQSKPPPKESGVDAETAKTTS